MALVVVFLAAILCVPLHLGGFILAARIFRLPIERISLFYGPKLVNTKFGEIELAIGMLPMGGYVRYPKEAFEQQSLLTQCLVILSGSACLLLLSLATIGPRNAGSAFAAGFGQAIAGGISPLKTGWRLVAEADQFARRTSVVAILGTVAAKSASVQLLPIPALNGGQILMSIARVLFKLGERTEIRIIIGGLLAIILLWVSWCVAVVAYFVS